MKYNSFLRDLRRILSNLTILSSSKYSYKSQEYYVKSRNNASPDLPLEDLIYSAFHCKAQYDDTTFNLADQNFIGNLSLSNTGHGTWNPGWSVKLRLKNEFLAEKNGLTIWTPHEQFYTNIYPIKKKTLGFIALQKELRFMSSGFYTALGNTYFDDESGRITRIYWNVQSSAAALLLNSFTTQFNNNEIPFMFKILSNPGAYPRTDAAVSYIKTDDLPQSKIILKKIFKVIKLYLNPETSIFTKKLAPGLGLAQSVTGEDSFGQIRSRILADALIYSFKKKSHSTNALKDISFIFQKNHINPKFPYLNYDEDDIYEKLFRGVFN